MNRRTAMRAAALTVALVGAGAGAAWAQTTVRVRPVWASGEIAIVDGARRSLVVRQGAHVMTFRLEPKIRIVRRQEPVEVEDVRLLREFVGERVKISYRIVSGSRVAMRILISEPPPRPGEK